jgi:hypothetical protein
VVSLLDGEICYAIDQDQYYQNEGGALVSVGATKAQGALADTSVQPGDNVSDLTNDANYITLADVPGDLVTSVNTQTGDVVLDTDDITEGTTNLYSQWDNVTGGINYADGKVGIGTTSPASVLNVKSPLFNTTETVAAFGNGSISDGLEVITNGNLDWGFNCKNSRNLIFSTNQSEAARVDSSGRLLVGASSAVAIAGANAELQSLGTAEGRAGFGNYSNTISGPILAFGKSRATSVGSNAIVLNNDTLGAIRFAGDDGTDINSIGASIEAQVDGTPADSTPGPKSMPGRIVLATTADGASSPTERMRINSAGNIGVGSTDPQSIFVVRGNTPGITLEPTNNTTQNTLIQFALANGTVRSRITGGGSDNDAIRFSQGSSERMCIASGGNIGIGVSDPEAKLSIVGTNTAGGIKIVDSSTSASSPGIEVIAKRGDANSSTSFSGKLLLSRNRTEAAIAEDNQLGSVSFGGNHTDGTEANILYSAALIGVADGDFNGASDMPTALAFYTGSIGWSPNTANANPGTERMRISSAGNTGIGTTDPQAVLDVKGRSVERDVAAHIRAGNSGFTVGLIIDGDNETGDVLLKVRSNNTATPSDSDTKFIIYGDGTVGIGTTSPGEKLEVNGTIKATDINFTGLATYADDSAAGTGGLVAGDVYKTSTGELRIKL